jgi:hypothetical protein
MLRQKRAFISLMLCNLCADYFPSTVKMRRIAAASGVVLHHWYDSVVHQWYTSGVTKAAPVAPPLLPEGLEVIGKLVEVETGKDSDALDRRPHLATALTRAPARPGPRWCWPSWIGYPVYAFHLPADLAQGPRLRLPNRAPMLTPCMLHLYAALANKLLKKAEVRAWSDQHDATQAKQAAVKELCPERLNVKAPCVWVVPNRARYEGIVTPARGSSRTRRWHRPTPAKRCCSLTGREQRAREPSTDMLTNEIVEL